MPFAKSCPTLPLQPKPIESFLASVKGSDETKRDSFNALRTFFRSISKRHRIPNPMDAINPPRRSKTRMATLEAHELMRLLHSAQDPRDRAILALIMDNGVRAGEVCSLQEIMGHTDIKTTQKYATLDLTDIIKKHRKFSPLRGVHAAAQDSLFAPEVLKQAEEILKGRKSSDNTGTGSQ